MIIDDAIYQRTWDNSSFAANYADLRDPAPRAAYMQACTRADATVFFQAEVARVAYLEAYKAHNDAYASYELDLTVYERAAAAAQAESNPYTEYERAVRWDATTESYSAFDRSSLAFKIACDAYGSACDSAVRCTFLA